MTHTSLASWLSYIESQHPSEIALGLDRGNKVFARLNLSRPKKQVITVAGTNGKGSTCAMLTQYLCSQHHSVGTYTSPHFLDFNERIAVNNAPCDDGLICRAFEAIEAAREDIPLTYFEFSTLAALWVFDQSELDYWVLEVGLGGRLDSVNMVDTDVAVVTSIALDHMDWLGDNIDVIAREKTGIARRDKLLISGVVNPPNGIATTAGEIGAQLRQKGVDFSFQRESDTWSWSGNGIQYENLPIPSLPLQNAATVVAVLVYMGLAPTSADLITLFSTAQLTGRFQQVASSPEVYIDVAHNPEAAIELAQRIGYLPRRPIAVCGMLKDKDIASVMASLADRFSAWFCCDLKGARGAQAVELMKHISQASSDSGLQMQAFPSVRDALNEALSKAKAEQRAVIVFGSFVTVSDYLALGQSKE
ncbi:bifunctional tetrahydrofolate synthase/dihydrofolate synthase [Marinomonas sp. M1K-6]|uniref:Dihydrofolate synthase/folylpolyglutamate synthase n=1 Tax=Marinomonas profundi TaxID=2726122 RepID=A0A847RA55_9GAMM|nr:bifunctional tetrahydrofolate synthase/dihydrofolate synthase [Marinomonas profundi]NLQ18926.1 bifunctional tetrahydrofolate synthase/dihydrofolate synthase [Marinomonas profundi]UDV02863.1 bifunctional tetrahydrofolate synthase/dihydrofolate synthase [Marinomonas profundi]